MGHGSHHFQCQHLRGLICICENKAWLLRALFFLRPGREIDSDICLFPAPISYSPWDMIGSAGKCGRLAVFRGFWHALGSGQCPPHRHRKGGQTRRMRKVPPKWRAAVLLFVSMRGDLGTSKKRRDMGVDVRPAACCRICHHMCLGSLRAGHFCPLIENAALATLVRCGSCTCMWLQSRAPPLPISLPDLVRFAAPRGFRDYGQDAEVGGVSKRSVVARVDLGRPSPDSGLPRILSFSRLASRPPAT